MSEFNVYVKEYFQDWLDINAINQFKTKVTQVTPLKPDWINF